MYVYFQFIEYQKVHILFYYTYVLTIFVHKCIKKIIIQNRIACELFIFLKTRPTFSNEKRGFRTWY